MPTDDEIIKQAENEFHQGDGSWDELKNAMGGVYNVSAEEAEELMRKAIQLARLAALDDCKTLLEGMTDYQRSSGEVAIERLREEYNKAEVFVPESDIGWKAFGRKAIKEIEKLMKT